MTVIVAVFGAIYLLTTGAFALGLLRRSGSRSTQRPFVSVVVAARNEEDYIANCVDSLLDQSYPSDLFEVIVVDDDSEDATPTILARFDRVRVYRPDPQYANYAAKKRPLATGIAKSQGEIILTTDADCTVPRTWVETMVQHLTPEVDVVVGYSRLAPARGWVHAFQSFDFHAMLAAAAGAIGMGSLWAASGQNLGYRRKAYDRVGGLDSISDRPSGDDVLLVQLLRRSGSRAAFCFDPKGHATTWRSESLGGLLNQRKRWASNAPIQLRLNPLLFLYVCSVFCVCASVPLALIFGGPIAELALILWGARLPIDAAVILLASRRLSSSPGFSYYPFWLAFQIPYVLIVGVGGSVLGFRWKGRPHHPGQSRAINSTAQPDTNHGTM